MATRTVPLGEILTTHGLDGWLKLKLYNDKSETLSQARQLVLQRAGDDTSVELEAAKPHGRQWLIKLRGIDSIDDGKSCAGAILSIAEERLPALGAGEYYLYQVVGYKVLDTAGVSIGTVLGIFSTPGGELLVVNGADKEYLIPTVKDIVESVDAARQTLTINPPLGLLDL